MPDRPLVVQLAVLLLLATTGCSSIEPSELDGEWRLDSASYQGDEIDLGLLEIPSRMSVDGDSREFGGSGGCNDFSGSFTYSDGEMMPEDTFFTLVGCSLAVETLVDSALQDITSGPISVSGDSDQMVWEGGETRLRYVREDA